MFSRPNLFFRQRVHSGPEAQACALAFPASHSGRALCAHRLRDRSSTSSINVIIRNSPCAFTLGMAAQPGTAFVRLSRRCVFALLSLFLPTTRAFTHYQPRSYLHDHIFYRPSTSVVLFDPLNYDFGLPRIPPLAIVRQSGDRAPKFIRGLVLSSKEVGLSDGTATESLFFVFKPEPGKSISDYEFSFRSSNEQCLISEDFTLGATQKINGGFNVSATVDFSRWVGVTEISIVARDKNSSTTTTSSSIN